MSATVPPTQNTPIFNNEMYTEAANATLTVSKGDQRYLKYPNAQGAQNMQDTTVNGKLVCNNSATFTQQPRQQLNSSTAWNSTSGPIGLAKNAQTIINPLVTGAKSLIANTFGFGISGTFNFPENGIVYDAKRQQFVVCSFSGGGPTNQVKVSTNGGVSWVDRSYAAATSQADWCIFYFDSIDTYLFTLVNSAVTNGRAMISTDGCNTFTLCNTPSSNLSYRGAAYSPELNVMVMCCASANQLTTNGICYSLDKGLTWNDAAVPAVSSRIQVIWAPELKRFFTTHTSGYMLYSDDGINWTSTTVSQGAAPLAQSSALEWSRELGMMVSRPANNNSNVNNVSCSYDGLTWFYANNTSFFPSFMVNIKWIGQLGLFVTVFGAGTGQRMAYSQNGLDWYLQTTPSDLFYRSIAYSPQLGLLCAIASQATDPRGFVTTLSNRMPSSWTVFDSSYNRIDALGNWLFKTNSLYTDSAQTIKSANGIELNATAGTDRQVYTSYVTYRNQNDNALAGQMYASAGDMVYDSNVNSKSHVFAATNSSGVKSNVFAINSTVITSTEPISCLDNIVLNGATGIDRQFYTSYVNFKNQNDNANACQLYASNGDMLYDDNVNGRSHIFATNDSSGVKTTVLTLNSSQITATERTKQQLNNSTSTLAENGYMALDNETARAPNPLSTGIGAVSTFVEQSTANNYSWRSICWSPRRNLYAAVSDSGVGNRVMTSPNGVVWTSRTSASDNAWQCVCWCDDPVNLFVAVSNSGTGNRVMTSPTGVVWTSRISAADNAWSSVSYSADLQLIVAVSQSGSNCVMTSTDGINWTARTPPNNNGWTGVVWASGLQLFVACSNAGSGRVMTSKDGITWTTQVTPVNDTYTSIAYSNSLNRLVCVADTGAGSRCMYSNDAINWFAANAPSTIQNWASVTWSPELQVFCACSYDTTVSNGIMYSLDGISWTNVNIGYTGNQFRSICWAPETSTFACVMSSGTAGKYVYTSAWNSRIPMANNVFNSPFNSISNTTGDWTIQGVSFTSPQACLIGSSGGNTTIQTGATLRFNASTSGTAGGGSGQYLNINVNGTSYKIALLNV